MSYKNFMVDQVKPKEKTSFPGKPLLMMNTGILFATVIGLSISAFYIK